MGLRTTKPRRGGDGKNAGNVGSKGDDGDDPNEATIVSPRPTDDVEDVARNTQGMFTFRKLSNLVKQYQQANRAGKMRIRAVMDTGPTSSKQ